MSSSSTAIIGKSKNFLTVVGPAVCAPAEAVLVELVPAVSGFAVVFELVPAECHVSAEFCAFVVRPDIVLGIVVEAHLHMLPVMATGRREIAEEHRRSSHHEDSK